MSSYTPYRTAIVLIKLAPMNLVRESGVSNRSIPLIVSVESYRDDFCGLRVMLRSRIESYSPVNVASVGEFAIEKSFGITLSR